ncbi:hypothetical protein K8R04_04905, partial [Candidatus Uhrbacteria bacterium]|nr:hypothetical protein [Candidatus Uhrbacteria bacterium]
MKKIDKPAVKATLAKFNQARELISYGTAGLERLREALGNPDSDEEVTAEQFGELLATALDHVYDGAAALQYVRPLVMGLVDNCEVLQGLLRQQLRATRQEGPDALPFPENYL